MLILTGSLNWLGSGCSRTCRSLARIEEVVTPERLQTEILKEGRAHDGQSRGRTPIALTIAGSDSSGGAGIQADLKTFTAFGVYGASVITALTAQNTQGVHGVETVTPQFVLAQIDAVLGDLDVARHQDRHAGQRRDRQRRGPQRCATAPRAARWWSIR